MFYFRSYQVGGKQMSFDIYLIASTATPPPAAFQRDVRAAVASAGGRVSSDGELVTGPDGFQFEMYGGGNSFSLTDLTPAVCKIVFATAQRTNAYIVTAGGGDLPTLKIDGTAGRPKPGQARGLAPIHLVVDPQSLCVKLGKGFDVWSGYASAVRRHMNAR
jgi:hypothetical protein